jgi:hypothetical protein
VPLGLLSEKLRLNPGCYLGRGYKCPNGQRRVAGVKRALHDQFSARIAKLAVVSIIDVQIRLP